MVTKKDVVEGHAGGRGDMPYEITDLARSGCWPTSTRADLGRVKLGTPATLPLQAYPNREFKGKVIFIDPLLDPKTRTAKVQLTFPNPTASSGPRCLAR